MRQQLRRRAAARAENIRTLVLPLALDEAIDAGPPAAVPAFLRFLRRSAADKLTKP